MNGDEAMEEVIRLYQGSATNDEFFEVLETIINQYRWDLTNRV